MPLSISNFNNSLGKSAILAALILVNYSLMLKAINPKLTYFQNQWVANYARAEGYIYKNLPPKVIIAGSSMAARMEDDKLESYIYNLSLNGGSPLTALKIIKKSSHMPDIICVETNTIERSSDDEIIKTLFTPIVWRVKKQIIALQFTYEPMNILTTIVKDKYGKKYSRQYKEKPNDETLRMGVALQLEGANRVDEIETSKELVEIKELIDYFYDKGVKVVFFQMPVHPQISSSKKYEERKRILYQMFSGKNIKWVENGTDDDSKYSTSDGIHLMAESASDYTIELNKNIKNFMNE